MLFICLMAEVDAQRARRGQVDESLIAKISDGDMQAFSEFYAATQTSVYAFALSILKNTHDAQDIMQDAYVRIHSNASSYRPDGKPMAWVFTIVRNVCLMHLRKGKSAPDNYDEAAEHHADPHRFAESFEDNELIETAMSALSDDERQIVVLHVVAGMKHREIAALLDMPLSTVLSRYNRSLSKMKKRLEHSGSSVTAACKP